MLSFIRMFRGTFHMMFPRLNWSSQPPVVARMMPSCRPAVASVRRPPPKKNAIGIIVSPRHRACDGFRPQVPRTLEALDRLAERPEGSLEALRVPRVADHRDDGRGLVEGLEHRPVVLIQPVELGLLDADRRADPGVPALRVTDLRLDALEGEDRVPDRLEALVLAVHGHPVPDRLELAADRLDAVGELDPQEVGRGSAAGASSGGHDRPPRAHGCRAWFIPRGCLRMGLRTYLAVLVESYVVGGVFGRWRGIPRDFLNRHQRANAGRSPSMTAPAWPSMRMYIAFPLCWYSMNQTGAGRSSPDRKSVV